jgi:hypothetical protein
VLQRRSKQCRGTGLYSPTSASSFCVWRLSTSSWLRQQYKVGQGSVSYNIFYLHHHGLSPGYFFGTASYVLEHIDIYVASRRTCTSASSPPLLEMSESGSSSSTQAPGQSDKGISALNKALAKVDLDGHDLPPSPAPSSPRNGRQYAIATELVFSEGTDQYNASSVPIYQVCGRQKARSRPPLLVANC